MKKIFSKILCLTILTTIALPVNAINNEIEKGYVSVSYTAEKEVSPDTVEVSIAIKTEDKKSMQTAVSQNREISDKVYNYLKSAISTANGDSIKTTNYSVSPNYIYDNNKRIFDRYTVSNNIIIKTKNIDKISTMLEKSIQLGATNVNSLNFSLSEKDKYCSELLASATANSKQRAEIVAQAGGGTIDKIRTIDASCSVNQPMVRNRLYMAKAMTANSLDSSAPETGVGSIESGLITIYANVNASYFVK